MQVWEPFKEYAYGIYADYRRNRTPEDIKMVEEMNARSLRHGPLTDEERRLDDIAEYQAKHEAEERAKYVRHYIQE